MEKKRGGVSGWMGGGGVGDGELTNHFHVQGNVYYAPKKASWLFTEYIEQESYRLITSIHKYSIPHDTEQEV